MFRMATWCVILCGGVVALMYAAFKDSVAPPERPDRNRAVAGVGGGAPGPVPAQAVKGEAAAPVPAPSGEPLPPLFIPVPDPGVRSRLPLVVPEGRILPLDRQEVPSERDGTLLVIGTEVKPGEQVSPDRLFKATSGFLIVEAGPTERVPADQQIRFANNKVYRRWTPADPLEPGKVWLHRVEKAYKRLEVGDDVQAGQVVALVDPAIALNELSIKVANLEASESEKRAAAKTKDEALRRVSSMDKLRREVRGAVSEDDYQGAVLTAQRYREEEVAKGSAVIKTQQELIQASTLVDKHQVRTAIPGTVKVLYKYRGEAIKQLENLLQLQSHARLRVESLVEWQDAQRIHKGATVLVEATRPEPPKLALRGHLGAVTCVAVSRGPQPLVISGSGEDRTLRAWDPATGQLRWRQEGVAVRSLACSPAGAKQNLLLLGSADGSVRLLDLDKPKEGWHELADRHQGAVHCVAFSPDGALFATGGEDRAVCLWDTAAGKRTDAFPNAHRGPVTSLQFTPNKQLVSAGRDNVLAVWAAEADKPLARVMEFDRRGGDVAQLGVSPDGRHVLFDQGKELQMLSLETRQSEGVFRNPPGASNFTTFALFSPDGKAVLTNGASESRLQLWRAPAGGNPRASELRQFIIGGGAATCGAFDPDGRFAVTGTQDRQVLIWPMPGKEELESRLEANNLRVERSLDNSSRQVRIWAEVNNPGWLLPGGTATLVIPQE